MVVHFNFWWSIYASLNLNELRIPLFLPYGCDKKRNKSFVTLSHNKPNYAAEIIWSIMAEIYLCWSLIHLTNLIVPEKWFVVHSTSKKLSRVLTMANFLQK